MSYQVQGGTTPHQALHSGSDPTLILELSLGLQAGWHPPNKQRSGKGLDQHAVVSARSRPCPLMVVGNTLVGLLPPYQSHQLGLSCWRSTPPRPLVTWRGHLHSHFVYQAGSGSANLTPELPVPTLPTCRMDVGYSAVILRPRSLCRHHSGVHKGRT